MVLYFSGTGNSEYAARAIADLLQDDIVCSLPYIREHKSGVFESQKPWIFVFPVYVAAMADIFYDFVRCSEFSGCKKAYFIATCASDMGISPDMGREICRQKGWEFMGAEKIVMPQNYIALFPMTAPDEIKKRQQKALLSADKISQAVKSGQPLDQTCKSPAQRAMIYGTVKLYDRYFTGTGKFRATDQCIGCGLCERVCPLNNIHLENHKPQWDKNCIHCMSCINRCPKGAIEYGKGTVPKARYVCRKYKPNTKVSSSD